MARRLILDTGVLIERERSAKAIDEALTRDDDIVIAAVTAAELRAGLELASDRNRRSREEFLVSVFELFPVEPYDLKTAEAHGVLLAYVHKQGAPRGAIDLMIAATAVATGRILVTTDAKARFGDLPGVECVLLA